jgi:hypothetical protein
MISMSENARAERRRLLLATVAHVCNLLFRRFATGAMQPVSKEAEP